MYKKYSWFRAIIREPRDIAYARLEEPDATLKELGEKLSSPVGKSGVNHRLRKLSRIAQDIREKGHL
nr:helix-turn-helix domain-containing protein [Anaerobutyricum hallii]